MTTKRSSPLRRLTLGSPLNRPKVPGEMNKLEAAYAKHLTNDGVEWRYERYTLILRHGGKGKKGLRYTPDFAFEAPFGGLQFHEVKGHKRTAGIARLKMAAEMFPEHRFFLVTWEDGEWVIQEI